MGRWSTVARSALAGVVVVFAVLLGGATAAAAGPNVSLSTRSAFTYDGCAIPVVAAAEVDDGPDGEPASYEDVDAALPIAARVAASVQGYLYDSSGCIYATNTAAGVADEVPAFARSQYGRVPAAERAAALETTPTCPYCGTNPSSQVDYITALRQDWGARGWADDFATRTARVNDPGNLIGACASCNASKGARVLGEGPGQWWLPGWPSGTWWPFGGPG